MRSKINVVNPITLEEVPNPSATHAKVSQDEKAHHSNDTQSRYISCVEYHTYYNQYVVHPEITLSFSGRGMMEKVRPHHRKVLVKL